MICRECNKRLNEMTLICDSCGANILYEKQQLDDEGFIKKILPNEHKDKYSKELKEVIRNAYYLSNIKKDYSGASKKYVDKYIEYAFLRVYYEENKLMLLTRDFPKETTLEIYQTLVDKKIGKDMSKIMLNVYKDDYENKKLPELITNNVEKVYLPNFNINRINSNRLFRSSFSLIIKESIKSAISFLLIGLTILLLSSILDGTKIVSDTINDFRYNIHLVIGLGLISGIYFGIKRIDEFPVKDSINSDPVFKKHIKIEAEKKLKTIKYRIKKGR